MERIAKGKIKGKAVGQDNARLTVPGKGRKKSEQMVDGDKYFIEIVKGW